ncbi:MAG: hypothetical protein K2W96_01205 [Gemmataceae bacterium]|nr:hypothetical protein [Gemmataceae bacterium]
MTRAVLALPFALLLAVPAQAEEKAKWGTITGQVVWAEKKLPDNPAAAGLPKGCVAGIRKDELIVDPKTKGVKNVAFWLVDAKNPAKKFPVHPAVAKAMPKDVTIDQPCCQFEARVAVVADGQRLVAANSAAIAHNCNIGGKVGRNFLLGPKTSQVVGALAAETYPIPITCNIHGWMKAYVVTAPTPYAAVTAADGTFTIKDAPAGDFMLVAWHERIGWLYIDLKKPENKGKKLAVKPGKNDQGKIDFKLPADDE